MKLLLVCMILVVSVKHCVGQSNPNAAQSAGNSNAGGTVVDLGGGKTGIIAAGAVGTGSNTPVTPPKPTNQFTSSTAVISPGGTAAVGLVFHVRQPQPTDPDYEEKKKIIIDPAAIKARNEARAKAAAAKEQPPSNSGSLTTTTTLPRNTDPNVSPPNSNPTVPPSTLQNQNQPPSQPPSSPTPSTRTPPQSQSSDQTPIPKFSQPKPYPKSDLPFSIRWSKMVSYFYYLVTRIGQWNWKCQAQQIRATYCMMQMVMAFNVYIQQLKLYWYPDGKLRNTSQKDAKAPNAQAKVTGHNVTIAKMEQLGIKFYNMMVSTYSDYDSDNQRQFPRQGIEYELCQEYNFPGLKGWSNEQVQWFKDNYIHIAGKIGLKRMEYSGAVTSAGISDFKYWYSLTPAERPLVGLTDEIACRINYLGLLLYSANSADANLGKTIEIIYWLQQQCYYEVEWVDSATNYPKEPTSPVSSAITIQGKDLPKVIHDRLSEDKKKDAAAGKKESIPQVFPKYPAV